EDADSSIYVYYKSIRFIPLQYDRNGYVVFYQAHITLDFMFKKDKVKEHRKIVGRFEFPIRPSAIISNDLRLKAIEQGSLKALDEFITYLSVRGLLVDGK
ncbi:MAG: Probable lipoprotein Cj1090c, partial [uncultured Sulfurovum sp.]